MNGKLKVYMIPVISSSVTAEIDSSTEFTVVKEITNWTYIMAGDIQGWVRTYGIKGGEQQPSNVAGETEEKPNTEEPNTQVPEEKPEKTDPDEKKKESTASMLYTPSKTLDSFLQKISATASKGTPINQLDKRLELLKY